MNELEQSITSSEIGTSRRVRRALSRRSRAARAASFTLAAGVAAATGATLATTNAFGTAAASGRDTGAGQSPSAASAFGNAGYGYGFGSAGTGNTGTAAESAGAPANSAAIAAAVSGGLVDINTNLKYEGEAAAGTGIVLTSNGEVLTNNHVIEGATSISVTDIGNGKTYSASVVGYDLTQDIAVLQLKNASGLKTAKLGDSSSVRVGDAVVGIGNAGGVGGTPSYAGGAVTAVNQSVTAGDESSPLQSETLTGVFGTNADIEPGDSGGPLVNSSGQVIGIDTAGSSSSGNEFGFSSASTSTQGFAIPINEALGIARQITAGTSSSKVHIGATAFLGIGVLAPTATTSGFGAYFGTGVVPTLGAEITDVLSASPAAKAGLSEGDTITALNGLNVTSPAALTTALGHVKPGATVSVVYVAPDGQRATTTAKVASGPPA